MRIFSALLAVTFAAGLAEARTYIIPNTYKNKREAHESPIGTGFSDRRTVGGEYSMESIENETNGTKTDEDDVNSLSPFVYWSFPFGLSLEFTALTGTTENKPEGGGPNTDTDNTEMKLNAGYRLPTMPLVLGVVYATEEDETGASSDETTRTGFGVGYQLPSGMYVGGGINSDKEESTGQESETEEELYVGVGFISGDTKKPDMAGEVTLQTTNEGGLKTQLLLAQGLMNHGDIEYQGALGLYRLDSDAIDGMVWILNLGMDYDFTPFYIAPSLTLNMGDIEFGSTKSEQDGLELAFEAGYRADVWSAYGRYKKETDTEDDGIDKEEDKGSILTVGFNYHF